MKFRSDVYYEFRERPTRPAFRPLPPSASRIYQMFKGQRVNELQVWMELVGLPSPSGKRTMWQLFQEYRRLLIEEDLVSFMLGPEDAILEMMARMVSKRRRE